jgi:hypothetical protein
MQTQAIISYARYHFEEARLVALHAIDIFEKLGAAEDTLKCRKVFQWIEEAHDTVSPHSNSELLEF